MTKYEQAVKFMEQPRPKKAGRPYELAGYLARLLRISKKSVLNYRLHCKMSEEAWNASYAQVKK
jgi:hypothetical protein